MVAVNLTYILEQGARGSHLLFETEEIRHAFGMLERLDAVDEGSLERVQEMVRTLAGTPTLSGQRSLIASLPEIQRDLLILFYFQFLDRFISDRQPTIH
jgi:hypothetical protein